jgi:hypothetical protein
MRTIVFAGTLGVVLGATGIAGAQQDYVRTQTQTQTTYQQPTPTYVQPTYVGVQNTYGGGETTRPSVKTDAPKNALELGVQMGWSQGFGGYQNRVATPGLHDLVNAGGAIELQVGYRFDPHWLLGVYGSGAEFGTGSAVENGNQVYSATAGLQAAFHTMPYATFDPWISIGSGWRGMWVNNNFGTDSSHGMDLARAQIGIDYRVAPTVTIAPVFGATMSMFFTREGIGQTSFANVAAPELNTFLFGGLMGRFDVGPTEHRPGGAVAKR